MIVRSFLACCIVPATVIATLAACGGASAPGAAEPASAPPTATAAVGRVTHVGSAAEGIVYAPREHLLAVAVHHPDRLLLLDPTTLSVVRTVRLPGAARHLQLGAGGRSVLVPAETANRLVQVALPSGATTSTAVRRQPHEATADDGYVIVGDEFGHALSVVRDGHVVRTIGGLTQPGGVIVVPGGVLAVDVGAFAVSSYSVPSFRRTGHLKVGSGPTHAVAIAGDRVIVADTRGDRMIVLGLHPLRRLASLRLPGTPYGVVGDPTTDTVWVTLTARNQVVGLDVAGREPRVVARYPTVRQPNTVAVAPGSRELWVTGTAAGVVQRITR